MIRDSGASDRRVGFARYRQMLGLGDKAGLALTVAPSIVARIPCAGHSLARRLHSATARRRERLVGLCDPDHQGISNGNSVSCEVEFRVSVDNKIGCIDSSQPYAVDRTWR